MITADVLKDVPLFAGLPERELGVIASRAADIYLRKNDWLIQEGEVPAFFIVLSGQLIVSKLVGGVERNINQYLPGDHAGEVPLLLGSPAIANLRAAEPTRVCRIEPGDWCLRARRPGDRVRTRAGSRKVSDVFIDAKVPRALRDRIPVLARGSLFEEGAA